jgi:minor extracellular serine protease Vpr
MQFLSLKFLLVPLLTVNMSFVLAQSNKTIRLMKSAKQDMELCNYKSAILRLDKIIDNEEMNVQALFLRGICKDSLKIYSQALIDYDKIIAFSSNNEVYKSRGILRMKLGNYLEAIYDFDRYLEINTGDESAYYYRAQSKAELNKFQGAMTDEIKAYELNPNYRFLIANRQELPLDGRGVVVGIIDGGFDYTHPAFYDTTYSKLRIAKAWIQDLQGTPPLGFDYGTELNDTESLLKKKYDFDHSGSHGTGVSSIAAGSGLGGQNIKFQRGVAYESELVFVSSPRTYQDWREMNMTTIIDGINYIFSYARSVNKPAVINISMGSLLGARDGGSSFSNACEKLVGPGKILVFCAMNEGNSKKHIGKSFTATDTSLHTLVPIEIYNNGERRNYIDAWGDSLQTFCLQFGMYANGTVKNKTNIFCMDNSIQKFFVIGSDNDTCFITLSTKSLEYNMKSHATMDILSKSNDTLAISVFAKSTNVHMWQDYFDESWSPSYGSFLGNNSWATEGDNNYTIGEMGCAKSAITVGASVSGVFWKDLESNYYSNKEKHGMIASYSSKGPTLDNRMKPEITAPVGTLYCATNSYDTMFTTEIPIRPYLVSQDTSSKSGRVYSYMAVEGTSFASPMVAGIIALMLQVCPNLEPDQIKTIIQKTAIKDCYTTLTPDSTQWGAGKIDSYAALKQTISLAGGIILSNDENAISILPNPSQGNFTLSYLSPSPGYFCIEVSDTLGHIVQSKIWQLTMGDNKLVLNLSESKRGSYLISIIGQGGQIERKVLIQ